MFTSNTNQQDGGQRQVRCNQDLFMYYVILSFIFIRFTFVRLINEGNTTATVSAS